MDTSSLEGKEGTLPDIWAQGKLVRCPPKNVRLLFGKQAEPQSGWFKFELVKIKCSSDKLFKKKKKLFSCFGFSTYENH